MGALTLDAAQPPLGPRGLSSTASRGSQASACVSAWEGGPRPGLGLDRFLMDFLARFSNGSGSGAEAG